MGAVEVHERPQALSPTSGCELVHRVGCGSPSVVGNQGLAGLLVLHQLHCPKHTQPAYVAHAGVTRSDLLKLGPNDLSTQFAGVLDDAFLFKDLLDAQHLLDLVTDAGLAFKLQRDVLAQRHRAQLAVGLHAREAAVREELISHHREGTAARLSELQSRIRPHFLFNTLNNLYGLAVQGSSQTPDAILRLSEILRFMLYESDKALIPAGKELKIIREYIELERMRYDASLQLTMEADIEDEQQLIPPLLLMPLVENAFKHGVSDTLEHPFIHIHLAIRQATLLFEVRNSKSRVPRTKEINGRIGLGNLRRQLELLFAEYKLDITDEPTFYSVKLFINLSKHAVV